MRTIKFRGKTIDGTWIIGDFVRPNVILEDNDTNLSLGKLYLNNSSIVIQDTVGQFTGLHDKNGREIYEGDIVRHDENGKCYSIIYEEPMFRFAPNDDCFAFLNHPELLEVVGNIHDLIEKGGEK